MSSSPRSGTYAPPLLTPAEPPSRAVIGTRVHATRYDEATRMVTEWAHQGRSATVCATSVHGVIEAIENAAF